MEEKRITDRDMERYAGYLIREEKSKATREKYLRDIRRFRAFAGEAPVTKDMTVAWKTMLTEEGYAATSVNSMLASVNSLFDFLQWPDCKVKNIRLQRQFFCAEEKELTKAEYLRLLEVSQKKEQINLILKTICGTGIRISELRYFTVEAVRGGVICVTCKSKTRRIFLPNKLKKLLLDYARRQRRTTGAIFAGRTGRPLDRSSIWRQMKRLCAEAGVKESKVFPHNLRKLFARTFYGMEKNIAELADILGHSSINTTRIYIMSSGTEHQKKLNRLGLVV